MWLKRHLEEGGGVIGCLNTDQQAVPDGIHPPPVPARAVFVAARLSHRLSPAITETLLLKTTEIGLIGKKFRLNRQASTLWSPTGGVVHYPHWSCRDSLVSV